MVWLILTAQALISASGLLTLRFFMPLFAEKTIHSSFGVWAGTGVGVILYGVSFLTWLFILSRYQVSFAYPFTIGATLTATVLGAIFIFGEKVTPLQLIGLALLVLAVFLVSTNPESRA